MSLLYSFAVLGNWHSLSREYFSVGRNSILQPCPKARYVTPGATDDIFGVCVCVSVCLCVCVSGETTCFPQKESHRLNQQHHLRSGDLTPVKAVPTFSDHAYDLNKLFCEMDENNRKYENRTSNLRIF